MRPELAERTLTISGASKAYAMTGWRIGWSVGPAHVIRAMGNVQSQQTGNPCSVSQYAALAAVEGDQECVEKMRREFEARRDLVCKRLAAVPGVVPGARWRLLRLFNVAALRRTRAGRRSAIR
jgi:aspartate aminotransferase